MATMGSSARNAALLGQFGNQVGAMAMGSHNFGLCVGNPFSGGEEAQPANGYARVNVLNSTTFWNVSGYTAKNKTAIVFPASTGAWVSVSGGSTFTHWGIWDGSGNLWYAGRLAVPMVVAGVVAAPQIGIGEVVLYQGA